jgi:hypothetical protein
MVLGNGNGDSVIMENAAFSPCLTNTITIGNGNGDVVDDFDFQSQLVPLKNAITVGNGNDTVYVGNSDTMKVGTGKDSFVFEQAATDTIGAATIDGFGHHDVIDFNVSLFVSYSAKMSAGDILQSGSNMVVTDHAGDTVTLTE